MFKIENKCEDFTITTPPNVYKTSPNATDPLTTTMAQQFDLTAYLAVNSQAAECVVNYTLHLAPGNVIAPLSYDGTWVEVDLASGALSLKEFELGFLEVIIRYYQLNSGRTLTTYDTVMFTLEIYCPAFVYTTIPDIDMLAPEVVLPGLEPWLDGLNYVQTQSDTAACTVTYYL